MKRIAMTCSLLAFFASSACETPAPAMQVEPWPTSGKGPTPYTAAQIRDANPSGTVLRFRMTSPTTGEVVQTMSFVDSDADGTTVRQRNEQDGALMGAETEQRAGWEELREHARFDAEMTTREAVRGVSVPAGTYDCWLYTVRQVAMPGVVQRLYFAHKKPGPPVLIVSEADGKEMMRMELLEYRRGA
jgi:hypothetical protein